jgi:hypothetical protein
VRVDGDESNLELPVLEACGTARERLRVRAERLTETTWVVDADAL